MVSGSAYRLYAKNWKTKEWILVGMHYQHLSWTEQEVKLFTKLGIETKIEEYQTYYADEG